VEPERSRSSAKIIAACVMLLILVGLIGCTSDPAPVQPTPILSLQASPTSTLPLLVLVTPSPTVRPLLSRLNPLRANPLVEMRSSDLVEAMGTVVNGTYCSPAWRSSEFPTAISLPVASVKGDLLMEWNSSGTNDYISLPGNPTYGIPASYTIATSADSTNGKNGTWREVVSVTGNTARTRAHRFPFAGARWVRMTVKSAVPGPLGDTFVIDEIDLHDASAGTDDSVFFLGDSITAASFNRCPARQPSFAALVHRATPRRFPAMIDGGVGGVNSGYGVTVVNDWLDLNPDFRVWAIGYGTNDAWQKVSPSVFEGNLQTIVESVLEADRVPVVARIPFAAKGPVDADVRALNEVVDRVTARYGLPPGPDLYGWFSAHRNELGPDGIHPTDAGTRSINRLWYEALRPLYGSSP
jgi:acyl-CoA thioesterase I